MEEPSNPERRLAITDWSKTPVYLMVTHDKSETKAMFDALPATSIQRMLYQLRDKDRPVDVKRLG